MPSKERELLEQIKNGKTSWSPRDATIESYERFKAELADLTDTLDSLVSESYIGGYDVSHTESHTGKRYHDSVRITHGLTLKGQDRTQWPD